MPDPINLWPIGDSLTAPYVPTLVKRLAAVAWPAPVTLVGTLGSGAFHNEGHPGYRIQKIADNLAAYRAALAAPPNAAVVLLGTNDLIGMPKPNISALFTRWTALLAQLDKMGVKPIVVATIPRTARLDAPGIPELNAKIRSYASTHGIPFVDLERVLSLSNLGPDGVHLTAAGSVKMGNAIADVTIPALQHRVLTDGANGASSGLGTVALLGVLATLALLKR